MKDLRDLNDLTIHDMLSDSVQYLSTPRCNESLCARSGESSRNITLREKRGFDVSVE